MRGQKGLDVGDRVEVELVDVDVERRASSTSPAPEGGVPRLIDTPRERRLR